LKSVPDLYVASKPIEKNGHLTCFAEHALSISTFLDTHSKVVKGLRLKFGFEYQLV